MYEVFILSMDGIASHHISWSPISQSGPVVLVRPNYWLLQTLKIGKFPRLQLRYIRCLRRHNLTRLAHINHGMIFGRQKRPEIRNLSAWSASFSGPLNCESKTFRENYYDFMWCKSLACCSEDCWTKHLKFCWFDAWIIARHNRRSRNKVQVIKFQDSVLSEYWLRECSQGFFLLIWILNFKFWEFSLKCA